MNPNYDQDNEDQWSQGLISAVSRTTTTSSTIFGIPFFLRFDIFRDINVEF